MRRMGMAPFSHVMHLNEVIKERKRRLPVLVVAAFLEFSIWLLK